MVYCIHTYIAQKKQKSCTHMIEKKVLMITSNEDVDHNIIVYICLLFIIRNTTRTVRNNIGNLHVNKIIIIWSRKVAYIFKRSHLKLIERRRRIQFGITCN